MLFKTIMARVLSRFVRETGDRLESLGVPAVYLSRALYAAAIAGYVAKVAYPALSGSNGNGNAKKNKRKRNATREELEEEETVSAAHIVSHAGERGNHFEAEK